MRIWLKKHRLEIFVFFTALAAVLGTFLTLHQFYGDTFMVRSDGPTYLQMARNLIRYKIFSKSTIQPLIPSSFRVPLYPAFLASIFLFTNKLFAVGILQCFLAALGVLYVFKIGKMLGGGKIALVAAFLFGLDFFHLIYTGTIHTETLFVPLFMISTYYFLLFLKTSKELKLIIATLFLGLIMLTRPIGSYLWIFILLMLIFIFWRRKLPDQKFLSWRLVKIAVLFGLTLSILVVPWMVRNQVVFGKFALSSSRDYNLYFWFLIPVHAERLGISRDQVHLALNEEVKKEFPSVRGEALRNLTYSDYFKDKSLQALQGHKLTYLKAHFMGSLYFFVSNYYRKSAYIATGAKEQSIPIYDIFQLAQEGKVWEEISYLIKKGGFPIIMMFVGFLISGIYFIFLILNVFYLFKRKRPDYEIFLYGVVGYFALMIGPLGMGCYRYPVLPFIIILALLGFSRIWKSLMAELTTNPS